MKGGLMRIWTIALISTLALSGLAPVAWGQRATTQPAHPVVVANEMQLLASQAMAKGDYASALPLLQKAADLLSDQPDTLGPILEQIRVCRRQLKNSSTTVPSASAQAMAEMTQRTPHPALLAGQKLELPIKELGNFEYDEQKGGNIPADVKQLEGSHFQTSGYMVPLDQAEAITQFALVPSLFACCYGQPPQIQHTIIVQTPKGKAVPYFPDQITVEGTLHVSEQRDGGFIVSIFQMDAVSVRVAAVENVK